MICSLLNNLISKLAEKFAPDPDIPNCPGKAAYTNSGYDRGHLFPYADAACNSTDQAECFYMSNMLPQLHALNAGDWKTLETRERVWAHTQKIHIIAGGYGSKGQLTSGVSIPESCWKAVYVDGKWHGYVMPNENTSTGHSYRYWEALDIKRFQYKQQTPGLISLAFVLIADSFKNYF